MSAPAWTAHPGIVNLATNQTQLDMDGCMVGVSRQAVDETLAVTADLVEALDAVSKSSTCGPRVDALVAAALAKVRGQ